MGLLLVKVTAVLAIALAVCAILRRSTAALRHLLLTSALGLCLALPFSQRTTPGWQILPLAPPAPEAAADTAGSAGLSAAADVVTARLRSAPAEGALGSSTQTTSIPDWTTLLPLLWAAGSAILLLRLAFGIAIVERAARRARPVTRDGDIEMLERLRRSLGVRRTVALRSQKGASMPAAWGCLRPVILLPGAAGGWSGNRRRDVMAHELAHVAGGDGPVGLLAHLACAVYWFHPLAWAVRKRLIAESECAADDLVISTGAPPKRYAENLLSTAAEFNHHYPYSVAPVMAARTQLEQRIMAILTTTNRAATTPATRFLVFSLAFLALACLSNIGWARSDNGVDDIGDALSQALDPEVLRGQSDSVDFGAHLEAMGIRGDDVDALIAGLASADALTRGASAWALRESNDPRVVEPLIQAGYDADARVRQWALRSLARWPEPAVAALQIDRLQDADAEVRQWAVRGLGAQDPAVRAQPLAGALADDDAEVREWAVRGLAGADDPSASAALAAMLAAESDAAVSEWLIRTIPGTGAEGTDALSIGLQSPHAEVRQWAVRGLEPSADPRANDLLIGMLADSDAEVRQWSARGLGFCGNDRAVAALEGLAADADEEVREWAGKSLAKIRCTARARIDPEQ